MKKALFVLPVILLLATGCQLSKTKTILETNVKENSSPQASVNQTYANTKYGYTLSYNPKWRIAKKYSIHIGKLQLGSIYSLKTGCLDPDKVGSDEGNKQMQNLQNCLANSPYLLEMNNTINNYESNWRAETAETVIFTDSNQTEEDNFISEMKTGTKSDTDFPEGHEIGIFPYNAVLSFQKETATNSNSKYISKYFYLSNGVRAYKHDSRLTGYGGRRLKISIPHDFITPIGDGGIAKSLVLESNVVMNSDNETDFLNMAKSVKFNQ